jgi:outer membrane biosynthesis protein TonB
MRTLSVSAEEIEEAKKEASRASSQKHREKQAPEERKRASRESEKKCREKKKRNDEEERKRNEEEAAREKAARAQADRQREARLLAKFQFRAEFWLRQSRTGYSDSRFPVVMDDVEKSVVELLVGTASRLLKVDGKSAIEK